MAGDCEVKGIYLRERERQSMNLEIKEQTKINGFGQGQGYQHLGTMPFERF